MTVLPAFRPAITKNRAERSVTIRAILFETAGPVSGKDAGFLEKQSCIYRA
jgi:hypothetical protein